MPRPRKEDEDYIQKRNEEIGRLHKERVPMRLIGLKFGISAQRVSAILKEMK